MQQVVTIITKGEQVLIGKLTQEKKEAFGGLEYVFPGGKVEESETLEEAAIREAYEETGLNVEISQHIGERIHPVTQKEIHYFLCKVMSGELTVAHEKNNDIEELLWVDRQKLLEYMPTLFEKVAQFFNLRS
ncbi:MAG: NUDIX hydrolase [Candidatus Dojkabacteria bacterium]|nr:MAG: NUDIX hydrolase [Candidatus Dojkabacteria bacterium]